MRSSIIPRFSRKDALSAAYQAFALAASVMLLTHAFEEFIIPPGGQHLGHDWNTAGAGDGREDWAAAQLFLKHQSPYTPEGLREIGLERFGFGHPPTTAFWFIPVARLSMPVMGQAVAITALLVLLLHVMICVSELAVPAPLASSVLLFSAVFSTSWMVEHLHIIQISEFIAFLYVLSWYNLRRGREAQGGAFLGLACTLKLFPGVMVLYLLLARRWRAVAAAIGAYLPIAALMTWGYGVRCWPLFFGQQGAVAEKWIGHIRNASVHGIVLRLFTPTCVGRAAPSRPGTVLAGIASIAILAAAWLIVRKRMRDPRQTDIPFALFSVVSAFVNPWIWEHYRVLLILPLLVLARSAFVSLRAAWSQWAASPEPTMRPQDMPVGETLAALAIGAALIAVLICLDDGQWDKVQIVDTYRKGGQTPVVRAWLHARLHVLEVMNWLPWPLTIAALAFQARRSSSEVPDDIPGVLVR